ncbi:competence/damage-inducible protein A [Ferroacidibacillus organovorans]|uniref:Putative competence-damage inducible protein n=1 Tax=Ferroacidibacillus organovorans TaxID=1765683 RepID=A0A853K9J3_9BACL|nr:competence/damage-inducible protein A [Ferroacidibacillus organovorans]KYP79384.1 hypothetical protein AYJ22_14875 [Ferroacidibacillus organovorans]OAG90176.1 hypothetical protein AYW79_14220 [Ferroacidibacillus organovorans]
MRAELIAVGTEILLGQIDNSHAKFLSQDLAAIGISVFYHTAVGDNAERLIALLKEAAKRSDVILLTGGLGPTEDDLTREGVAGAFDLPLTFDEEAFVAHVTPYFERLGRTPTENNKKQAWRVGTGIFLPNPRGTAPGQYVQAAGKHIFLLPGPPLEMRPMYMESVRPRLVNLMGESAIVSRVLRLYGIGESSAELEVKDLMAGVNPTVAPLASEGEMVFRITASAQTAEQAHRLIDPIQAEMERRLGKYVYGYDDDHLASVALARLVENKKTVSFAESCTGGLLTSLLVDCAGSSRALRGSVVAYDNAVKMELLQVSNEMLQAHGAVSEEVAAAMAEGVRLATGSDVGVSVTGIAGPDGGTKEKPVGLVYIGVTDGKTTNVTRRLISGDRTQVRIRAAKHALFLVIQAMKKE